MAGNPSKLELMFDNVSWSFMNDRDMNDREIDIYWLARMAKIEKKSDF